MWRNTVGKNRQQQANTQVNSTIDDMLYDSGRGGAIAKATAGVNGRKPKGDPFDALKGRLNEKLDRGFNPRDNLAYGHMCNFAETGGWDPKRIASIDDNIGRFKTIGKYGAESPEMAARLRGGGVYDEFAKTGGVSDAEKENMRARGNSVIPSFYATLKEELDRGNVSSGGFNP